MTPWSCRQIQQVVKSGRRGQDIAGATEFDAKVDTGANTLLDHSITSLSRRLHLRAL